MVDPSGVLSQPDLDPTARQHRSLASQREWNRTKDQTAPWWPENSKEAYKSGVDGLARALKHWSDSRAGRRRGRLVGFPRFRKEGRTMAQSRCCPTASTFSFLGSAW